MSYSEGVECACPLLALSSKLYVSIFDHLHRSPLSFVYLIYPYQLIDDQPSRRLFLSRVFPLHTAGGLRDDDVFVNEEAGMEDTQLSMSATDTTTS